MKTHKYISKSPALIRCYLVIASCILVFSVPTNTLIAQETLPSEQVEVLKNFDAQLTSAKKIHATPKVPVFDTSKTILHFAPKEFEQSPDFTSHSLQMASGQHDEIPSLHNGHVDFAIGLPSRIQLHAAYRIIDPGNYALGFQILHEEASSDFISFQQYRNQGAKMSSSFILNKSVELEASASYVRQTRYLYGKPGVDTLNRAALQRDIDIIDLQLGGKFFMDNPQQDLNMHTEFSYLLDGFASSERNFLIDLDYRYHVNSNHSIQLMSSIDLSRLQDTLIRNLNNFLLHPSYQLNNNDLTIRLGYKIYNHIDKFSYFPQLYVSYALRGAKLQVFGAINGGLTKNNYRNVISSNPFVQARLDSLANTEEIQYSVGMTGVNGAFRYSLQSGLKTNKNVLFFTYKNDGTEAGFFRDLYDDAIIPYFSGSFVFDVNSQLAIQSDIDINFYQVSTLASHFHKPLFESYHKITWQPQNLKWSVEGDYWLVGGIPYKDSETEVKFLKPINAVSVTGNYIISNSLRSYLQIRNVLGQRWERWLNYPGYSINILAGIQYKIK